MKNAYTVVFVLSSIRIIVRRTMCRDRSFPLWIRSLKTIVIRTLSLFAFACSCIGILNTLLSSVKQYISSSNALDVCQRKKEVDSNRWWEDVSMTFLGDVECIELTYDYHWNFVLLHNRENLIRYWICFPGSFSFF